MERQIFTLPLCSSLKEKLLSQGYKTIKDVRNLTSGYLQSLGLMPEETLRLHEAIQQPPITKKNARELLDTNEPLRSIPTLCPAIDELMKGGVSIGRVTEFCGGPGIGKTQIGIQLCVNAAIPVAYGGLGSESIFIDAEGSFTVERALSMARGMINQIHVNNPSTKVPRLLHRGRGLTETSVLSGIHHFRAKTCDEQIALMQAIPALLDDRAAVKLVVIDSISFHFRQGFADMAFRTRLLNRLAQDMMSISESREIAIVYTNQVTTKVFQDGSSDIVPALGDSWSQCVNTQIRLLWNGSVRTAGAYKAPHIEQRAVSYVVTEEGIRSA